LGAWIVLRRLAFFSHSVGGATFPGLVIADAAGLRPLSAALAVALAYAAAVWQAGARTGGHIRDAATGVLLAGALAVGVVLASDVFQSGTRVDGLLFGTLLGISGTDVWIAAAAALAAVVATLMLGPAWLASGFDRAGARALGAPVAAADLLLLLLIAATVVAALPAVGALLTTALFIVPAATVRLFARTVPELLLGSMLLAAVEGICGAYVSLWLDAPPGPAIAVLGGVAFAAVALARAALPAPRVAEVPA
jgi:manganese/iron transport system permease protein